VRSVLGRLLGDATISRVVTDTGERARAASERQWSEQVSRELGQSVALDTGPGRERLQAWIAENTARIQGLRNATLEMVKADLETAILSQVRPEELAAHWERVGLPTRNGTMRGRALVIARDQLGTLAMQLAREQHAALGIERYRWDARPEVSRKHRKVHRGRHGAEYRWDSPPPGGHAGEPIGCYCRAAAVVDRAALRQRFGGR
jgi:SPP1 gp7 family putative phage head morphogenesis protein